MRRRAAVALAAVVVAVGGGAVLWSSTAGSGVPTTAVRRRGLIRRVVAEGYLKAKRSTPLTVPVEAQEGVKIAWLVPDGSRVRAGDTVVRFDPTAFEERLAAGVADRRVADAKIGKAEAQRDVTVSNLDRDAALAESELNTASRFQSKDKEIFSRFEIISSEIDTDLARKRKEHAESVRSTKQSVAAAELALLGIERRKAEQEVSRAEQGLRALEVTATHDGLVVFQRDWRGEVPRVGDQEWPGAKLAEIPDLSVMEAEIWVLEADAGGLAVGRRATVRVEARPAVEFSAEVTRVDALAKPRQRGVPVQYFGATLALERTDSEIMKPGQRVTATLVLDEIPDALIVPLQAVFERDGKKVVFRRSGRGFQPVEVTLGPVSLGEAVVTDGLKEGDRVALRDPEQDVAALGRPAPTGKAEAAPDMPGGR